MDDDGPKPPVPILDYAPAERPNWRMALARCADSVRTYTKRFLIYPTPRWRPLLLIALLLMLFALVAGDAWRSRRQMRQQSMARQRLHAEMLAYHDGLTVLTLPPGAVRLKWSEQHKKVVTVDDQLPLNKGTESSRLDRDGVLLGFGSDNSYWVDVSGMMPSEFRSRRIIHLLWHLADQIGRGCPRQNIRLFDPYGGAGRLSGIATVEFLHGTTTVSASFAEEADATGRRAGIAEQVIIDIRQSHRMPAE